MSVTLHDFPFCLDACHYLPNVTNIKETNQQRAVLNVVQAFHIDVPECHISTHFVTIYVFHFLFQFNLKKKHPLLYFSKIHTHVGCQWHTVRGGLGCSNPPPPPRNSEDIGGVLDRISKKNRRLDFLL